MSDLLSLTYFSCAPLTAASHLLVVYSICSALFGSRVGFSLQTVLLWPAARSNVQSFVLKLLARLNKGP